MAFTTELLNDSKLRIVAFADPSVGCDEETYTRYLQGLDETLLELDGEPTRFVMRKFLDQREIAGVQDDMISFDADRNVRVKMSSNTEEVRRALVGIENPMDVGGIVWAKDPGDRWADRDLVSKLAQLGIVANLYEARQAAINRGKKSAGMAKKS